MTGLLLTDLLLEIGNLPLALCRGVGRPSGCVATLGGLFDDGMDDPDTPENEDGIEVADVVDAIEAACALPP